MVLRFKFRSRYINKKQSSSKLQPSGRKGRGDKKKDINQQQQQQQQQHKSINEGDEEDENAALIIWIIEFKN